MQDKLKQALALTLAFFVGYAPVTWAKTQYRFTDDSNAEVATMDDLGNITATSFSGDGSGLTSIPAGTPADGSVTSAKLTADSVDTEKIVDNAVTADHVSFNYAGSSSEGGAATTATALAANGTNCSTNQFNKGVDASGNAESCAALDDSDIPDTITIQNLSGTNTGDQTITLTGEVTGSGTGSFAATIANGAITSDKVAAGAIQDAKLATDFISETELDSLAELNTQLGTSIADGAHTTDTDTWADLLQVTDTSANICAATPSATPKVALSTDGFDLFTATGTAVGQWRNTRTGAGACN